MANQSCFYPLSRRAFLHGLGVTMALPWLVFRQWVSQQGMVGEGGR
jgi:hypothetical protein